jgi:peptidyl-prolyl cis-trans isomerase SDCCAG10
VRRLTRGRGEDSDNECDPHQKKKQKGPSLLLQELSKYPPSRQLRERGKRRDETNILAALDNFRGKLISSQPLADVQAGVGKVLPAGDLAQKEEGGKFNWIYSPTELV